jgi:YVTN family beta-propeller protein
MVLATSLVAGLIALSFPLAAPSAHAVPSEYRVWSIIPVGQAPGEIAISRDGRRAYVTNEDSNNVSVINLKTRAIAAVVRVDTAPRGVAVSPDNRRIYVSNNGGNAQHLGTVSVIDSKTYRVLRTTPVIASPENVAIAPDGSTMWVTGRGAAPMRGAIETFQLPALELISGLQGYGEAAEDQGADGVAVVDALTGNRVWGATYPGMGLVYFYEQGCAVANCRYQVLVGANPQGLAFNANGSRAYVANADSDTVSVIDLGSRLVTANIPVGSSPYGVAVGPSKAFVTNFDSDSVSVIDLATNTVTQQIPVGDGPSGIAISRTGAVYVTNVLSNSVSVIRNAG